MHPCDVLFCLLPLIFTCLAISLFYVRKSGQKNASRSSQKHGRHFFTEENAWENLDWLGNTWKKILLGFSRHLQKNLIGWANVMSVQLPLKKCSCDKKPAGFIKMISTARKKIMTKATFLCNEAFLTYLLVQSKG